MISKSRSRRTNKKPTAARAKAHDRKLLERAEREAAEGTGVLPPASRSRMAAATGIDVVALPVCEVRSVCAQLKELTHLAVDAWACRDEVADGLEGVLVKLHAARMNLESEMNSALERVGGAS